jgi:1,2-diacylglycerol 3-alpha-glucosyltransferase
MKIGLFSDSYLPSLDGISNSIETFRLELEKRGHQVTVFAPAPGMRYKERSADIIRFPAVKGLFFDDYLTSMFFPPQALQRIKRQKLDVIHYHTPSQVGLLGAYFALRNNVPLISTYHTDLYEYVSHYPAVLPGTIALSLLAPLITRGGLSDFRRAISSIKPERNIDAWNKKIVVRGVTMLHNNCDYVIAPSRKIEHQLRSWQTTAPIRILPTGVDNITTNSRAVAAFRSRFDLEPSDEVILFVGRLGSEKNIDLLLQAFKQVLAERPQAKLVLVGKHDYATTLQKQATKLGVGGRTVFTGYIEHSRLGAAYAAASVFAFPSRTDTQGLVIHEAASAGLPIVMIDKEITEVVRNGVNGYFARNTAKDLAKKITAILSNEVLRLSMGAASIELASHYSAAHQAELLEHLYENVIAARARAAQLPSA